MGLPVVLVKASFMVFPLPLPVAGRMPDTNARVQLIDNDISVVISKGTSKSFSEQVVCIVAGIDSTGLGLCIMINIRE
jgi:hypothetical protein